MVNLLGTSTSPLVAESLTAALAEDQAFVHVYGKTENRAGRKMGHLTAIGANLEDAGARARAAASQIRL